MTLQLNYTALLQLRLSAETQSLYLAPIPTSIIKLSPTECKCPGYTDSKVINPPLVLKTIPEGCSIFKPDFIIPTVIFSHPKY